MTSFDYVKKVVSTSSGRVLFGDIQKFVVVKKLKRHLWRFGVGVIRNSRSRVRWGMYLFLLAVVVCNPLGAGKLTPSPFDLSA
ncbi:hypothetical protein TNCT_272061 [Trichonephila clavata]|uniref:Uncharacterized protein n=1 Tax=Trichonephila clavata TaxID=2740835 RepID=A0A8X6FZC9_TRICU|nr:hypothetical protein TNCT_272061 [Trichonephila clavata]